MKDIKIEYVDFGIANNYGDRIEMHKALLEPRWKALHDEILAHELAHTRDGWKVDDLKLDIKGLKNKMDYRRFILHHPSTFVQFSPIYRSKGKWYWDVNLCIFYAVALIVFGAIAYFGPKLF